MESWNTLGWSDATWAAVLALFIFLAIWELAWKGWALWKAGRNNHAGWFIALFIFNTAGILPILYIYVFSKNGKDI